MMQRIVHGPKAVIACVQGTATAAGCQLVSACDMAIASSDARFCTPGVNLGAFCTTPLVGIGRNLSRKHALEMALTGEFFDAADAERFGQSTGTCRRKRCWRRLNDLPSGLLRARHRAYETVKRLFTHIEMPLNDAFEHANQVMVEAMTSDESRQGVKRFSRSARRTGGDLVLIETDEVSQFSKPCAMLRWWVRVISPSGQAISLGISSTERLSGDARESWPCRSNPSGSDRGRFSE